MPDSTATNRRSAREPASETAEWVGRVLGRRYHLVAPIGAGTSARVYLADDLSLGRRVAVKCLRSGLSDDARFLRRFRAEAKAAAQLSHPNLLAVYDWGEDESDTYLVTEVLLGGSLLDLIDRSPRLTPSQGLLVALQVAQGLNYAHELGWVHRDIKPANLLFGEEGRLRIADFGIARAVAEAAWTEPEGILVGTARYAAPEQAESDAIDGKADVYSLALTIIEAVTGRVPLLGESALATMVLRQNRDVDQLDELGPLAAALGPAGRADPAKRPTAAELIEVLTRTARSLPRPRRLPLASPHAAAGRSATLAADHRTGHDPIIDLRDGEPSDAEPDVEGHRLLPGGTLRARPLPTPSSEQPPPRRSILGGFRNGGVDAGRRRDGEGSPDEQTVPEMTILERPSPTGRIDTPNDVAPPERPPTTRQDPVDRRESVPVDRATPDATDRPIGNGGTGGRAAGRAPADPATIVEAGDGPPGDGGPDGATGDPPAGDGGTDGATGDPPAGDGGPDGFPVDRTAGEGGTDGATGDLAAGDDGPDGFPVDRAVGEGGTGVPLDRTTDDEAAGAPDAATGDGVGDPVGGDGAGDAADPSTWPPPAFPSTPGDRSRQRSAGRGRTASGSAGSWLDQSKVVPGEPRPEQLPAQGSPAVGGWPVPAPAHRAGTGTGSVDQPEQTWPAPGHPPSATGPRRSAPEPPMRSDAAPPAVSEGAATSPAVSTGAMSGGAGTERAAASPAGTGGATSRGAGTERAAASPAGTGGADFEGPGVESVAAPGGGAPLARASKSIADLFDGPAESAAGPAEPTGRMTTDAGRDQQDPAPVLGVEADAAGRPGRDSGGRRGLGRRFGRRRQLTAQPRPVRITRVIDAVTDDGHDGSARPAVPVRRTVDLPPATPTTRSNHLVAPHEPTAPGDGSSPPAAAGATEASDPAAESLLEPPADATGSHRPPDGGRPHWLPLVTLSALIAVVLAVVVVIALRTDDDLATSGPPVPPPALVGDYVGKPLSVAEMAADRNNWLLSTTQGRQRGTAVGEIIDQEPAAGEPLLDGDRLSIVVSLGPELTTVPSAVGLPVDEAAAVLRGAGLELGVVIEREDSAPKGQVLALELDGEEPDSRLEVGTAVDLIVSGGPTARPMPSFVGLTVDQAIDQANELGLALNREEAYSERYDEGFVVHTDPPTDALVEPGDELTIVVSLGLPFVAVPDVVGLDPGAATAELGAAGFTVIETVGPADLPVVRTAPPAGEAHRKGSAVTLFTEG